MQRIMLKSKIHRAVITQAELGYVGSLTVDKNLLEAADIMEGERVQVVNINNGSRLETYAIEGERGSGVMCLNGPAARCGLPGDIIIVLTYMQVNDEEASQLKPKVVFVNEQNQIVEGK